MAQDVFVKFDYGARDAFDAIWLRIVSTPRGRTAAGVALLLTAAAVAAFFYAGPGLVRHLLGWVAVILAVHTALTAVRAWPDAMFRRDSPDAAWIQQLGADFWGRKMTVDASDDALTVTVGQRSMTLRWQLCHGFARSRRAYLLRHGTKGFLVVPRRVFRTPKKDDAFRELASRVPSTPDATPSAETARETPRADLALPAPALALSAPLTPATLPGTPSHPATEPAAPVRPAVPKVGRNDPCPCGSGKKYKKCCLVVG